MRGFNDEYTPDDELDDVAEALGYPGQEAYNEACQFNPREVLDRIYTLKRE